MANNIGLDFGTTYSVISRLKNVTRKADGSIESYELEACLPSEAAHSPCQDSIVLKNQDGTLTFGPLAREKTGRKGTTVYKGFKMMLADETNENEEVLKARGYDSEYTPSRIVKEYIDDVLQRHIATNSQEEKIDKVVIGVPEIWFSDVSTIDCRTMLEDIVTQLPYVDEVELVSEPAAACAFFVENYKKNKNKPFNGKILLIDYGGGTLDIALCDVQEKGQCSEVSVIKRCGAGLNEEGFIGKAGIAFIEAIVKLALAPSGLSAVEMISNRYFYRCVNSVETALMNQMRDIKDTFDFAELSDREFMSDLFYTIEFDGEDYDITYGMLAKAYNEIINPVLEEKLDEMIEYMQNNNITVDKIAPVGGFCNFYLTQEQIERKFARGAGDTRFSDIINDRRDCEKAISYGAALIAEDIIGFKQLSPYHLGIASGSENELRDIYYAISKGDDIVYDEPVFIKYEDGSDVYFGGAHIPLLVFNLDDSCERKFAQWGEPLEEYKAKLALQKDMWCKIGFSLDRSMIITLHKQIIDPKNPDEIYEQSSVRLNDIYSILGNLITVRRN